MHRLVYGTTLVFMSASRKFELVSEFVPSGDQPAAIASLLEGLHDGEATQTLLGVTGSGKTFTIANICLLYTSPSPRDRG